MEVGGGGDRMGETKPGKQTKVVSVIQLWVIMSWDKEVLGGQIRVVRTSVRHMWAMGPVTKQAVNS